MLALQSVAAVRDPDSSTVFDGHDVHDADPEFSAYEWSGHAVQSEAVTDPEVPRDLPAGHRSHAEADPAASLYVPGRHAVTDVPEPVKPGFARQPPTSVVPAGLCELAGHGLHDVLEVLPSP